MNVKPGGTTGTVLINRGYCGPAISEIEYKYALLLAGAIETKPITRMLRHLIEPVARVESPLICDIGASMPFNGEPPVDFDAMSGLVAKIEKELSSGTSILVGGPVYNLLTSYIFGRPGSRCQFIVERDELRRGISIKVSPGTEARDFVRQSPEQNQAGAYTEYCLLEKLAGPQGSTVFVCAGTGAGATIAALTQLQHWKKLPNRLKRAPEFFILYEATAQTRIKSHPS